ncbi:MAG TPA: arsinothricin resistance N-acetyltransferase ArsN1 family B [Gammaproteobacteria bacterium]|nr:arsinothricin resistance N-acetyltransferase ArsN1 family B [Gammaproteobacteria bacterium]
MIRDGRRSDAEQICEIYNHYVRATTVTFEEEAVSSQDMAERIADVIAHLPWLVSEENGSVVGYAYATRWNRRSAYRYSVESTVYVASTSLGRGIGTQLYGELIVRLRARGVHCAVGGIALPNPASLALHEKLGFSKIGHFKEVGWKFGQWIDVGYWELIL